MSYKNSVQPVQYLSQKQETKQIIKSKADTMQCKNSVQPAVSST